MNDNPKYTEQLIMQILNFANYSNLYLGSLWNISNTGTT